MPLSPDRVVDAAADLADEIGFDAVSVSELARRLGVRTPSLYSHVGGSEDLLTRVALAALAEMADLAADAMAGRSGYDALVALAGSYRSYARAHPGRYSASRLRLTPSQAADSAGPRHAALARAVLHGYGVAGDDATHAVRLIGATTHGFIALESAGGFDHSTPGSEASWQRALEGLDLVLRAWGHAD
ncbi:TetR/AcrR family transcriptional regulator [Nocardioides marmoraquaticus]